MVRAVPGQLWDRVAVLVEWLSLHWPGQSQTWSPSEFTDEVSVDEYEKFKWNTLGDAVFEDYYGLWEPLYWLRGGGVIEGQTEFDRASFAERALRELHDEGLIYFFRVPPHHEVNTSGEDESLRLTPDEVDKALRGDWWRGREGLPEDNPGVWFGPTPAGEAACENPPEHIRKLWWPDGRPSLD